MIVALFSCINAVSMCFVVLPATHKLLSLFVLPQAISLHSSIFKVSDVVLVFELHHALAVGLVIGEVPDVDGVIGKLHIPLSHFMSQAKLTFVDCGLGDQDSPAVMHAMMESPHVDILVVVQHRF